MPKFPVDAPIDRVIKALENLGFRLVRQGNHISMVRDNPDGTHTPLTMPNRRTIKSSTLRTILTQSGISRTNFLADYENVWESFSIAQQTPPLLKSGYLQAYDAA